MLEIIAEEREKFVFKMDVRTLDALIGSTQAMLEQFFAKIGETERDFYMKNITLTWNLGTGQIFWDLALMEFPKYRQDEGKGQVSMCPFMFYSFKDTFYNVAKSINDESALDKSVATVTLTLGSSADIHIDIDVAS